MYYLVEETKDATNYYAVEVRKWCLCLMIFYLTELFEITMIPYCYRTRRTHGIFCRPLSQDSLITADL